MLYRAALIGGIVTLTAGAVLGLLGLVGAALACVCGAVGSLLVTGHLRMRLSMRQVRTSTNFLAAHLTQRLDAHEATASHRHGVLLDAAADAGEATSAHLTALAVSSAQVTEDLLRLTTALTEVDRTSLTHRDVLLQAINRIRVQLEMLPMETGEYSALRGTLGDLHAPLPPLGGWALTAAPLAVIASDLRGCEHAPVSVELGSGTSSVFIGLTLRARGDGHHYALEHMPDYADAVRATLRRHGVDQFVTVIDAPLGDMGEALPWYDLTGLPKLPPIDLLLIDGPPGSFGATVRAPGLPRFADALASNATVIVDDTIRAGEKTILAQWLATYPQLHQVSDLGKAVYLRWDA